MQKNIILVGLMGAGKSTIGRQLARRCKMEFHDSDREIEERTGVNIPTIFEIEGEDGFRDREQQVIGDLCEMENIVLATGGGSVLREENRECMKRAGSVVYLKTSPEQLYARISHDKNRPLMQTDHPLQTLRDLLKKREAFYLEVADIVIPTGKQRSSAVVRTVAHKLMQLEDELSDANPES